MQLDKFNLAIKAFDTANEKDPNHTEWNGKQWPNELLYAVRMTNCLNAFKPEASEALQLAARSQHICRWEIPRAQFPMDRKGYHLWRTQLKAFHADKAAVILASVGYEKTLIQEVKSLLLKKQLKRNADTQALEDVICLVFIQYYLLDFIPKHSEEKLISILQKTWKKMSTEGQEAALQLVLPEQVSILVGKALQSS